MSSEEPQTDAQGFVLAGGRSSRMGSDKALVEFGGRPMMAHALDILIRAGLAVAIAGARNQLEVFAPVVPDETPDLGPLGGVCAALEWARARWSVFIPVDLPLLPPVVIRYLLDRARQSGAAVVVASANGFTETFPVAVDRVLRPELRAALAEGRSGCQRELRAAADKLGLPVAIVDLDEAVRAGALDASKELPYESWFLNTNTKEELERAESYWKSAD